MRMMRFPTVLLLSLAACGRPPAEAEAIVTSLTGLVLDAETNHPIANALIVSEPYVKQAFTTSDGRYAIEDGLTTGGDYRISAEKVGYETNFVNISDIIEGENSVADILLSDRGPALSLSVAQVQVNAGSSAGTFRVSNTGDDSEPLTYSISEVDDWITAATPASGSVTNVDQTITVTIDRGLLPAGTGDVTGQIDVTSNGGSASVTVRVLR